MNAIGIRGRLIPNAAQIGDEPSGTERRKAAAAVAAFLRALPEFVTACRSHVEIAHQVEEAARG